MPEPAKRAEPAELRDSPSVARLAGSVVRGSRRALGRRRRAAAVVEMALACPLLVYLAFGVVEYGYYLYSKNTLHSAARDGVRQAILSTATNATVQAAVDSGMSAAGMQSCGYIVTTTPANVSSLATGTAVTCTVTASWGNFGVHPLPTVFGGIPSTKQLTCSVVMRRE